jgi:hypothetical protein
VYDLEQAKKDYRMYRKPKSENIERILKEVEKQIKAGEPSATWLGDFTDEDIYELNNLGYQTSKLIDALKTHGYYLTIQGWEN